MRRLGENLALADLKRAAQLNGPAEVHADLSILYSASPRKSLRQSRLALDHAKKACELTQSQDWKSLAALANAQALSGNMEEAQNAMLAAVKLVEGRVPNQLKSWEREIADGRPFELPAEEK